jgi:hypothetical protein
MAVIDCFDIAMKGDIILENLTLSSAFRKLKYTLRILSLHQPADILRYDVASFIDELTESGIRNVMKCRSDFSVEAVERIKLRTSA